MKLSQIVAYKELIDNFDVQGCLTVHPGLLSLIDLIKRHTVTGNKLQSEISHDLDAIRSSLEKFQDTLSKLRHDIDLQISDREPGYFADSYQLYDQQMTADTIEYILNRRLSLDNANQTFIDSRIKLHSNWQTTGMILRPGIESWISSMVALDPLYVVDADYRLFDRVKDSFNPLYIDRLRFVICNDEDDPVLDMVPSGQIGFALAYNFFHYTPFEVMKRYLTAMYDKLRPGGVLAFTFNDCDRRGAVELVERCFMCYTPGKLVKSLVETLGFEIQHFQIIDKATSWIEVIKPGDFTSLRGGQTLARFVAKSK